MARSCPNQVSGADLAEYRALFTAAPLLIVRRQPAAGHNISLGWAARSYHLNALGFAEHACSVLFALDPAVPAGDDLVAAGGDSVRRDLAA